jgi:hypothetical protein
MILVICSSVSMFVDPLPRSYSYALSMSMRSESMRDVF